MLTSMLLLLSIAVTCCVVLLAAATLLRWKQRTPKGLPGKQSKRDREQQHRRPHPRLDLATGTVPSTQSVSARRNGQAPPNKHPGHPSELRKRPDRAYFNADLGDLRDPDIGIAPSDGVPRPRGTLSRPEYR